MKSLDQHLMFWKRNHWRSTKTFWGSMVLCIETCSVPVLYSAFFHKLDSHNLSNHPEPYIDRKFGGAVFRFSSGFSENPVIPTHPYNPRDHIVIHNHPWASTSILKNHNHLTILFLNNHLNAHFHYLQLNDLKSHVKTKKKTEKTCFCWWLYIKLHICLPVFYLGDTPGHRQSDEVWTKPPRYESFQRVPSLHSASLSSCQWWYGWGNFHPENFRQFFGGDWNSSKMKQNKETSNYPVILRILGYEQQRFWYTRFAIDLFSFPFRFWRNLPFRLVRLTCHKWTIGGASKSLESISTNSHLRGVLPYPSSHQFI